LLTVDPALWNEVAAGSRFNRDNAASLRGFELADSRAGIRQRFKVMVSCRANLD
jgi:hypothetical protein